MTMFEVEGLPARWERSGTMKGRPMCVLAHGAGASMYSPFMEHVAAELVAREICVLRFHFPYMEIATQTERRRPPGPARRLLATWREILARVGKMRGRGPLLIGGKSMGGRYASMIAAAGEAPRASGLVYLGYPLHPPGKPEKLRADHLPDVPMPQLFVQGSKDKLCRPDLLEAVLKRVPNARLHEVHGADHSLAKSRKRPFEGSDAWLDVVAGFAHDVGRVSGGRERSP